MAMDRDELLRRLVTAAEFIENNNLTPRTKEAALRRYDALEAEFWELDKQEKKYRSPVPETVQRSMDTIRNTLEQMRKEDKQRRIGSRRPGA